MKSTPRKLTCKKHRVVAQVVLSRGFEPHVYLSAAHTRMYSNEARVIGHWLLAAADQVEQEAARRAAKSGPKDAPPPMEIPLDVDGQQIVVRLVALGPSMKRQPTPAVIERIKKAAAALVKEAPQ
jgi:hypothetical protein